MAFLAQHRCNRHRVAIRKRFLTGTIMITVLVVSVFGCGKKHIPPPEIEFTIESEYETNEGQPFYCAIRSVNANQFLSEGYDGVANMLFENPPNSSVLASFVILPGEDQELKINKPSKNDLGFYCFFTEPGEPWKIKLDQPLGEEYEIELGKNNILEAGKNGGWWPF